MIDRIRAPLIGITCEIEPHGDHPKSYDLICDYRYAKAVTGAGGHPVLLPIAYRKRMLRRYLEGIDGLVIVGGDDVEPRLYGEEPHSTTKPILPQRTTFETWLYRAGKRRKLPILGICYGMQLINVLEGGSLHQEIPKHRTPHRVRVLPSTHLATTSGVNRARVNSEHHQAVNALAPGFVVSAVADDGVIEAIEHPGLPQILAVQWHPERSPESKLTKSLFSTLVSLAASYRTARRPLGGPSAL